MTNDVKTNWFGLAQAIGIAAIDFYSTSNADGSVNWSNPIFYVGLVVAVLVAVKAYFTNKPDAPPTKPPVA
jgi:hypothetical protein